ncbi:hypothetical protein D6D17_04122 [Aureobasidium pullulans]|uniref:Uncharacterized protein n=1 Tax=Aureobasidium pullulans TaxID=5580 RepID=A0A4S8VPX8_AURPU|nr:hypothetical protein D6D24_06530 [Aureobasidium pullulans]THX08930.1 hypothetical protein D6D17_04122 [Aureobasidium pullulans]
MPPPDAEFPVEEDCADLASIGTLIETNITEISYIKSEQREFVQRVHKEQNEFAKRLEELHESQQDLLKKLNIIKSENQVQEINSLKAERQLFRSSNPDPFDRDDDDAEQDDTPTSSSKFLARRSSTNNKRKANAIEGEYSPSTSKSEDIKPRSGKLVRVSSSNAVIAITPGPSKRNARSITVDLSARAREMTTGPSKKESISPRGDTSIRPRDPAPRPGAQVPEDVIVYLDSVQHALELSGEEDDKTIRAWTREGDMLREEWRKQLKDFDKKNPDWPNKARTAGCVRSTIFNGGKCYLTIEDEGVYACKTCWNTDHFCVGWDEEDKHFWIRPQLPAARFKKNVGPFDLERFRSMKAAPTRVGLPAYWQSTATQ